MKNEYLKKLAGFDCTSLSWPGRNIFFEIAKLELEKLEEANCPLNWDNFSLGLSWIRERKDCQDFVMAGLIRVLYLYRNTSTLLSENQLSEITQTLQQAKFSPLDPGDDTACWNTENHQVLYNSAEYLSGQLWPDTTFSTTGEKGLWHHKRARKKLLQWLEWRGNFSFSEWNSACYLDEDAAALTNLIDFAEDDDVRRCAEKVFTLLLKHVALNSFKCVPACSQGRAYLPEAMRPDKTPMAALARFCWGEEVPTHLSIGALGLATGTYQVPDEIIRAGQDSKFGENRERHSLNAENAADFGVDPGKVENLDFFMGSGQQNHHLVTEAHFEFYSKHQTEDWRYYARNYYKNCKDNGEDFDSNALPHALSEVNLYSYKTRDYFLSSAQDYRSGCPGYQQLVWNATLGGKAVVFTTNPVPSGAPYGRPGPWIGNGIFPKVVQHKNVLIALYRIRPYPIYDNPPWYREDRTHAFFPKEHFDEVQEKEGWYFGRLNDSYLALKPTNPGHWVSPEQEIMNLVETAQEYEISVEGTDTAWICELSSKAQSASFDQFINKILAAKIEGDVNQLTYISPSQGKISVGWKTPFIVADKEVPLRNFPVLEVTS